MIKRYFLHLAYKGTNYKGWQIQPNELSVQQILQESISLILKTPIELTGCGRTDTGVHARNFYAHFDTDRLTLEQLNFIGYKVNCILPNDIKIYGIYPMHNSAHARFDCQERTYKYYISTIKEVFNKDYVWQYYSNLDIEAMNHAAEELFNYSDFTSFSKLHSGAKTNICKINFASWEKQNDTLVFTISADRFLRNMVRAIVGTLIEVGKKNLSTKEFCTIIENKDRGEAGMSVPACGLFLETLIYPYHIV
jgi:tRNA pseudouridine38-40 synthase